jgi:hypothetical protein
VPKAISTETTNHKIEPKVLLQQRKKLSNGVP